MGNRLTLNIFYLCLLFSLHSYGQSDSAEKQETGIGETTPRAKKWYESINIRGYMQTRYNRLAETNPELKCEQCDRSWGEGGGLFIRRMRIIFSGQVHERVYLYVQPDFASSASTNALYFGQIRDAYIDVGLDKKNEYRIRLGQKNKLLPGKHQ
jgi:hypothetical protein